MAAKEAKTREIEKDNIKAKSKVTFASGPTPLPMTCALTRRRQSH